MAAGETRHSDISRALAELGERAGAVEVAAALEREWEPFEAQMRRRMRSRPRGSRGAYRCLARAGEAKVRFHLEATGGLPRRAGSSHRNPGAIVRVRGSRRRRSGGADRRGGRR